LSKYTTVGGSPASVSENVYTEWWFQGFASLQLPWKRYWFFNDQQIM